MNTTGTRGLKMRIEIEYPDAVGDVSDFSDFFLDCLKCRTGNVRIVLEFDDCGEYYVTTRCNDCGYEEIVNGCVNDHRL